MLVRETMLETVKCKKNHSSRLVQDTISRTYKVKDLPETVIHEYKCFDFAACPDCEDCNYNH